jgi:hypothetical protein
MPEYLYFTNLPARSAILIGTSYHIPGHATKVWEQESAISAKVAVTNAIAADSRFTRREGIELYLYTEVHSNDISDYISDILGIMPCGERIKYNRFEIHQEPKDKCLIS